MRPTVLIAIVLIASGPARAATQSFVQSSPSGALTATIKLIDNDLYYSLSRGGQTLVSDSRLGLIIDDSGSPMDLGTGISSANVATSGQTTRSYATIGWHPSAVDQHSYLSLSLLKPGVTSSYGLEVRTFDDGLAFRYTVPGGGAPTRTILGEATEFNFPASANLWSQTGTNGDYANTWSKRVISSIGSGSGMMGPLVVDYGAGNGGGYTAVTESDYWGYSGMTYNKTGSTANAIQAAFIRDTSGWDVPAGSNTPWRTIITGTNLNTIVNSDMVNSVARPANVALFPQGVNTSWIKPGRSLWSWLDINGAQVNPTNMRAYTDRAQQLGFEYVTVDSGWKNWNGGGNGAFAELGDLVNYADARGVKIIAWKDSHDFYNTTTGQFDTSAMQTFLTNLRFEGAAGVKMDFLRQSGHLVGEYQRLLNFMAATYEYAAGLHLVVDFHGAPKTAGQAITFPNSLTTEHLRGLESGASTSQDATLPFTTLLAGAADYTPGVFSPDTNRGKRGNTTWPHQLAMGVLITSPITHWASGPQMLDSAMPVGSLALDVLRDIPATWDETRVLDISSIGTLAAFARRSGDDWFLALVSGDGTNPMTLNNIDLSFLGSGSYRATILRDGATDAEWNATLVASMNRLYDLDLTMRRGGGFVAMFTAIPEPSSCVIGVSILTLSQRSLRRRATRATAPGATRRRGRLGE